jgi:hypothetical protein
MNMMNWLLVVTAPFLFVDVPLHLRQSKSDAYICVVAYWDSNANGIKEDGEGSIGGVPIFLKFGGTILVRRETNNEDVTCIDVEAGNYTVVMGDESALDVTWTTRSDWTLDIAQGSTANFEFGVRAIEVASLDDNAVSPTGQSSTRATIRTLQTLAMQLFTLVFIVLTIAAAPISAIVLVINFRILKAIRLIQQDIYKEHHYDQGHPGPDLRGDAAPGQDRSGSASQSGESA